MCLSSVSLCLPLGRCVYMWDGQSLVPASSLLCTRQLSRGCPLLAGGELRDTHLFFHLHLPASDGC